jgi:hypothetical protein
MQAFQRKIAQVVRTGKPSAAFLREINARLARYQDRKQIVLLDPNSGKPLLPNHAVTKRIMQLGRQVHVEVNGVEANGVFHPTTMHARALPDEQHA